MRETAQLASPTRRKKTSPSGNVSRMPFSVCTASASKQTLSMAASSSRNSFFVMICLCFSMSVLPSGSICPHYTVRPPSIDGTFCPIVSNPVENGKYFRQKTRKILCIPHFLRLTACSFSAIIDISKANMQESPRRSKANLAAPPSSGQGFDACSSFSHKSFASQNLCGNPVFGVSFPS